VLFWGQVQFLWYDTTMDDEIKLSDERLSFEHSYFQLPSCHGYNRLEYVMKFTSYTSQHFKMTYMCCGTASGYEVNSYHLSFCWGGGGIIFSSKTKVSTESGVLSCYFKLYKTGTVISETP
jgi:hypothetical protein